jgi:1-aminocyclopropane-1-carboxylate deaminase/D-cysteine desulfhydrase-like pyridoxal-dependent ACC family enzyme
MSFGLTRVFAQVIFCTSMARQAAGTLVGMAPGDGNNVIACPKAAERRKMSRKFDSIFKDTG